MTPNLKLQSVTLRGIGSYLAGARLDIRPLTILCGTNGSGKSTWFKAIRTIKEWCHDRRFPFELPIPDWDANDIKLTNAYVHNALDLEPLRNQRDSPHLIESRQTLEFGPLATIGLRFIATQSFRVPPHEFDETDEDSLPQLFFWDGQCAKGTTFELRFAQPTTAGDDTDENARVAGLNKLVELRFNDSFVVRFSTENQLSNEYEIECSAGLLSSLAGLPAEKIVSIGTLTLEDGETNIQPVIGISTLSEADAIANCAISRIKSLTMELMGHFFQVGAIREAIDYTDLAEKYSGITENEKAATAESRHVGIRGEHAWLQLSRHAEDNKTHTNAIAPTTIYDSVSMFLKELLDAQLSDHWNNPDRLDCVEQPCFNCEPQNPRQMSSGFHQIFPMVVQTALMHPNEVLAIENPEVHLHPGLQLKLAEFFLKQAKSGKQILIETHSDLIVRRVLREILSEGLGIGQSSVGIYFSSLECTPDDHGHSSSILEEIQTDEQGRVRNWPNGFLDDDVLESRRLLLAMYGPSDDGDSDLEDQEVDQ